MATEFTVLFEGPIGHEQTALVNAAIQRAVLSVIGDLYPGPDDPEPHGPGAPIADLAYVRKPIINGIVLRPELSFGE